jgi:hypothetical protein
VIFALVLGSLAAASHASPEVIQDKAQNLLAEGYQTDLPRKPSIEEILEASGRRLDHEPPPPKKLQGSTPVTTLLLWVVVGGAIFLLLSFFLSELRGRAGKAEAGGGASPGDGDAALTERPLGDAEALAREGRFGEAIHVLLLRTLAELARRVAVPTSLTSREILTEAELPAGAHDALRSLVVAVEVSHFGGATPGREDYEACVDRFRAFVDAYRGAAVAA